MSYIVELSKETRWDKKTIGCKAFNLQKMMLLDVNVPECCVVTTKAYREFGKQGISDQLLKELADELQKWELPTIARSSSVAEDTMKTSKAGVFSTVADVNSLSDLKEAIENVWNSSEGEDIAVILQKQLKPDIAGVLFTKDPVSGINQIVIEYIEGMGEALVSGKKNPIRAKDEDRRFNKLKDEGKRLESLFGYPLDIEWAKTDKVFHILQARPITALPVPPKEEHPTYSMVLAEQFFSGPSSPLWFSLFKFLFEEFYARETAEAVGLDALPKEPLLIKHKDHMYVNTYPSEYLLGKAGGLGDFQQQLKVLPEDIRSQYEGVQRKHILRALGLLWKIVFLIMKQPNLRKSKVDLEFERETVPLILIVLEKMNRQPKTINEMNHQYSMLIELLIHHIRSSKWGMAHCIMQSSLMQRFLEKNNIDESQVKLLALMSGLPSEKTTEGIKELEVLAKKYKQDTHVRDALTPEFESYDGYREKLNTNPQAHKFQEAFESILFRYGHRRLARDFIGPSWNEEPMIPFNMLRKMLLYQNGYKLSETRENTAKKRVQVTDEIMNQVSFFKRQRFRTNSNYLIRYLSFRELQRFYLDMILSRMRLLFLTIGERMEKEGIIEYKEDVFFLEMNEIEEYLSDKTSDLKYIAAFRKMAFCESQDKPGLYLRNGVDFDTISSHKTDDTYGNVIKGESVSAGIYKGKVKVIETIDSKSSVLPGMVLVTKSIDPGQTQVFTQAKGMILEVGGVLSHGAILAREFGIPTVAQVNRATSIFYDGQEVVVNGTKGEVVIVERKK
ncbi:MAG: hypothetical protein JSW00_16330 [Thermoplasmata archaeon]|nr:MAG: hypothetical protein JSW00_16330 [Thermoplasmata archaeon]